MFISTVAWLPCVKVIHPKGLWKSCYLTQNLICERFFFIFVFFFLQIFHYKNDCTTKISCSVDGASAWDTIQLVCLFVWFNKYGKKLVKKTIQSIQEKEKTTLLVLQPRSSHCSNRCPSCSILTFCIVQLDPGSLISGHRHNQRLYLILFVQQIREHIGREEEKFHGVAELKQLQVHTQHPLKDSRQMDVEVLALSEQDSIWRFWVKGVSLVYWWLKLWRT